ncbi:hypothetical protein J7I97_21970 [Streptomyces sp. ISL-87]|nr:hypothetical protein [Streptomyces sp. ISL-21]MBT2610858.1 hypothetical protein [Streptomyces sp. ISL-87]
MRWRRLPGADGSCSPSGVPVCCACWQVVRRRASPQQVRRSLYGRPRTLRGGGRGRTVCHGSGGGVGAARGAAGARCGRRRHGLHRGAGPRTPAGRGAGGRRGGAGHRAVHDVPVPDNVYCLPGEAALARHPAVAQAVVVGRDSAVTGEEVCAFLVPAPGCEPDATAADEACDLVEALAPAHRPTAVFWEREIPLTAQGRPDKRLLRARATA